MENSDSLVSADDADHQSEQTKNSKNNNSTEEKKNLKTYGFQAVDITFLDKDGKEIQPAKPVRVAMTSEIAEQVKEEAKTGAVPDPVVVHVDDDGNAEQMELLAPEEIEPAQGKTEEELLEEDRTSNGEQKETETPDAAGEAPSVDFTADSFSVYAIVYTVDFHYEVNGKMYDFSIPGGGFVSLEHVVEVLGIALAEENAENGAENAENGTENGYDFVGEVPGVDVSGGNSTAYEEAIKLNKVEVSEPAAGESKPSLTVTVAKASTGTASEAGTGTLTEEEDGDYSILNRLIAYRIRLVKQDQDTVQPLQGAEFKLYAAGRNGVALVDGKIPDGTTALKTVTTGADGKADLGRLVIGEYWLAETKAPEGYLLLEKPIAITVTASGATALIDGQATTDVVISQTKDENNAVVPHNLTLDVLNPAKVEVTLDVEKMVETKSEEEFTFQFESRLTDVAPLSGSSVTKAKLEALNSALLASKDPTKDPIQTISVKVRGNKATSKGSATGSFAAVQVYGAGTYTFTITQSEACGLDL